MEGHFSNILGMDETFEWKDGMVLEAQVWKKSNVSKWINKEVIMKTEEQRVSHLAPLPQALSFYSHYIYWVTEKE